MRVLVTGGASGIGAASARAFAEAGSDVVIVDRDGPGLERMRVELPGIRTRRLDLADPDQRDGLVAALGADQLPDVLVNNVAGLTSVAFDEASVAEIEHDIALTLTLPVVLTRQFLPPMIERGGGVILNVASVNGLGAYGNEAYSAAKAGLIGFTRAIAVEYGDRGIRCNTVAPGSVRTGSWDARAEADPEIFARTVPFYPLGRIGEPADVAQALVFLASPAASWITGVCLPVDGGLTAGNRGLGRTITVDNGTGSHSWGPQAH